MFYETVFACETECEIHSLVHAPGLGIAMNNTEKATTENPGEDYHSRGNECFYIGFNCDDADMEYNRIYASEICAPTKPVLQMWDESFHFCDPDGNKNVMRNWPKEVHHD